MSKYRAVCSWRFLAAVALAALSLCLAAGSAQASQGPPVPLQTISVTLKPERHRIEGESVTLFAPGTRSAIFRLSESAQVEFVEVDGKKTSFTFAGGVLSVALPQKWETVPVKVVYSATFNDPISRNPAAEDPSYGVNGAITRDGTFLGGGALWYPIPPQVPAWRSLIVTAPAYTEAISYGRRVSRRTTGGVTRSAWEEKNPVGVLALCAGPYKIEESRVGGVDLYTYFYPDNASLAPRYLAAAAKYVEFYSKLFGPYPFEKFAAVENFFPTGYGFPSFTLLGGSVIRLPFIIDTSFPHEIAHSWWGNGVETDPREGNWSEGLVSYLADYYLKERHSAAEAREYRRQLLIDYASLVTPANDFPLSEFASRVDPASRAIGYGKGAMLFHMIRTRIGDQAFFEALRRVAREHMYGSASWSDFSTAFSDSARKDLSPFIRQWLTKTGGPRLTLAGVSERQEGARWVVSGRILQSAATFEVPVPLRLKTSRGEVNETVPVAGESTSFSISAAAKPQRLLLDPDAEIFRILSVNEIPPTVNSIKGSRTVLGVMTKNCRSDRETFRDLLASLSQGAAPVVAESEVGEKDARRHDLVFCGLPEKRALFPELPEGVEISRGSLQADGAGYAAPDALLLLVLQRKDSSGKVAALFQPMSQEAARKYLPKITHYGKYGLLLFAEGANRRKATSGASDGAVSVDLSR